MNDRFLFIKVHPDDNSCASLRRTRWIAVRSIKDFKASRDNQGSDIGLRGETLSVKESPEELLKLIRGLIKITR